MENVTEIAEEVEVPAETVEGAEETETVEETATEEGSGEKEEDKKEEEEDDDEAEIKMMKARVAEMEAEAAKLEQLQNTVDKNMKAPAGNFPPSGPSVDARSIYVGNVDYATEPEELENFFQSCGTVNRVTILVDKWTNRPKGFAYVEFKDQEAIVNAMILDATEFKGRNLKITPKRTNVPSFKRGGKGGRRGFRPRRADRGGYGYRRPYRPRRGYHPYH
mmetsp:Transcript_41358/g.81098  ORF Transcript_41358/g.81098 Transcript_41358/m.81098 type:complete len:220 (+) Transcript_41358:37-696(+)